MRTEPPLTYHRAVKPLTVNSEPATIDGPITSSESNATSAVWKLRVVYTASAGVLQAPPIVWDPKQTLELGRRNPVPSAGAWVNVQDERVSRQHARIYRSGDELLIEDLQSRNGSARNGARLRPGVPQPLHDGDVVRVGDSFLVIRKEPEVCIDAKVPSFVGVSVSACQVRCAIARCAVHDRAVLILGETGTGKEVTAQALHQLGHRRGQLAAINCAAIPGTLAEAQLFGVARGAFTGAVERLGAFGEAEGGTLFLDELGELPLEVQPKLLRALETREVIAIGGRHPVVRNVRIIAATNLDLTEAIRNRTFRADLYARIAADVIRLPPLRERREDILLLAQKFCHTEFRPSPRLAAALLKHSWPLNVREVRHVIAMLQDRSEDEVIRALAIRVGEEQREPLSLDSVPPAVQRWKSGDPVPSREHVVSLLEQHYGNLSRIEAQSGYSRRQFRRWAEGYGLDLTAYRRGSG